MPIKSDPRRLPRRNHYQEGPGFLFVATQGGRPVGSRVALAPAAIVRRRHGALRRWADGEAIEAICAEADCSRATLFRWRTRFEADGLAGLIDRERRGDRSDLAPELERAILVVRMLSYWNSRRIAAEFGRRGIEVSHGQVDRLLARAGTNRTSLARVPGPRYERTSPNELWHIDLKGPFYLADPGGPRQTCHFVALVDDFSRFLLGIRAVPTKEAVPVLETLAEAIELCGIPHELMTDNGTPFVTIMRTMLTLPADPRRTRDPAHPNADRHALDERQDRILLGDPPGRGPRPPASSRPRCRRCSRDRLRLVLQLPPAPWLTRLADAGRALRRHPVHRPGL